MTHLWSNIIWHLPLHDGLSLAVLNRYSDYPLLGILRQLKLNPMTTSAAPQVLYIAWKKIAVAARKINSIKANQLLQIADLFEKYPRILKKSTDPSQQPRPNTHHIVKHFRYMAKSAREYQWLRGLSFWHQGGGISASVFMPIVPFDSCLRLFCRKMHERPVSMLSSGDWVRITRLPFTKLKMHDSLGDVAPTTITAHYSTKTEMLTWIINRFPTPWISPQIY